MRRILKFTLKLLAALVLLLVAAVGGIYATTFAGLKPTERRDIPGVGRLAFDGYAGFSVLDAGDGKVVLIDAGNDPSGAAVLAALAPHTARDVEAVFLTHGHPDHIAALPKLPLTKIYAMAAEVPFITGQQGYHGPLPSLFGAVDRGFHLTEGLTDGSVTQVGTLSIEAFAVPGHTAGSAYLVNGALFLGDNATILKDGSLRPAPWVFSDDTGENRRALVALAQRLKSRASEIHWLVPAHSGAAEGPEALFGYGG